MHFNFNFNKMGIIIALSDAIELPRSCFLCIYFWINTQGINWLSKYVTQVFVVVKDLSRQQ